MIEAGESKVKEGLYYTKDHEWAQIMEDGTVLVGISDYAQKELGDLAYVE
ncbi:glycine cleavage system protein H, partial [Thermococci archaeon]